MRLVLAGHRRPLTWVRHAGGGPLAVSKNHKKQRKAAVFYWEGSGDRLGKNAALPAPTAAAALPTIVSSLGGSFCVHATFCLSRKRAPPSRRTRSCGYILRPALQPPSSPQNMPPLAGWLLRYNARQSTQLKQAGRHRCCCCWLRVCPCEQARVWCCVQARLVIFDYAHSVCLAP